MNGFDIAAYGAAILAVGGPILTALIYITKKSGPLAKKYFDKLILKLDEVVAETKENSKNMNGHLIDSEKYRKIVDSRFKSTLQEVKDVANLAHENSKRITDLELIKEKEDLERRKERFELEKKHYKKEC